MAQLPADRTKLNAAVQNQQPSFVADAIANREALVEAYDTIDLLNQKVDTAISNGKMGNEISSDVDMRNYSLKNINTINLTGFADFANGTGVRGKKVDGSTVLIAGVNSLNQILLGEIGEVTNIRGSAVLINDLPAWYAGNSPANFAPNGYQKLASGLIIQWGEATVPPNVLTPFVFPVAYTTFVIAIPVIDYYYPYAVSTAGVSTTGFNAVHTAPSDMTVRYIAVGW